MTLNKNTFKITVTDLETEEVVAEHNANAIFCGYNSADEDNRTGVFTACNGTERAVASAITGAFQGIYAVATQNPKINDLLPSLFALVKLYADTNSEDFLRGYRQTSVGFNKEAFEKALGASDDKETDGGGDE